MAKSVDVILLLWLISIRMNARVVLEDLVNIATAATCFGIPVSSKSLNQSVYILSEEEDIWAIMAIAPCQKWVGSYVKSACSRPVCCRPNLREVWWDGQKTACPTACQFRARAYDWHFISVWLHTCTPT